MFITVEFSVWFTSEFGFSGEPGRVGSSLSANTQHPKAKENFNSEYTWKITSLNSGEIIANTQLKEPQAESSSGFKIFKLEVGLRWT